MIRSDPKFSEYNVFVVEYDSPLFERALNPDEVAEGLREDFDSAQLLRHEEIAFLAHSMGGLVSRSFLLKYREYAAKVKMIHFFSTPTEGAEINNLARLLSANPQYGRMAPMRPDSYLADQIRAWLAARFRIRSFCAYEAFPTAGVQVVSMGSAVPLCTEPLTPVAANHIEIVKPADRDDPSYRAFSNAVAKTRDVVSVQVPPGWTLRQAIDVVVQTDVSAGGPFHPEYRNCAEELLRLEVLPGSVQAEDTAELIRILPSRLENPDAVVTLAASRNRVRSSYEIECR